MDVHWFFQYKYVVPVIKFQYNAISYAIKIHYFLHYNRAVKNKQTAYVICRHEYGRIKTASEISIFELN